MKKLFKGVLIAVGIIIVGIAGYVGYRHLLVSHQLSSVPTSGYKVVNHPTPNLRHGRNEVLGVVLHQTCSRDAETAVRTLTSTKNRKSAHVVIDYDGTRYVLAPPTAITMHAGRSLYKGRTDLNRCTIGIEFQANGVEWLLRPLTEKQIASAIEYLKPIIKEYNIPLDHITTHAIVRNAWNNAHPEKKGAIRSDMPSSEYERFMNRLKKAMEEDKQWTGRRC